MRLYYRCFTITISLFISSICSSIASASPDFGPVDMGDFYASLPDMNPNAKLGSIVKSKKIKSDMKNTNAWLIAYVSSDVNNHKTLVTGLLVAPNGTAPKAGRPIVAWAHGTTGTAQNCGPSQVLNPAQPLNEYFLLSGNSYTDFGLPGMAAFIKAGYVIVATDYQGLGGGGKHQYTVSVTQAQDVINSIRAATQVKEVSAGSKAIVYGWSQGGGATITAAGLTDYLHAKDTVRDDIDIIGFVAMAPFDIAVTMPANITNEADASKYLQSLGEQFSDNIFNFTHYAQNIWGTAAAFPDLKVDDIFTDQATKVINMAMERKCMHVAAGAFSYLFGDNYKAMLRSDIKNSLAWVKANRIGSVPAVKPMAPVIIYFGSKDVTVPPIMGKIYQEQMCKLGGNVTRVQLPGEQTHFSTPGSAEPMCVKWMSDRFAGVAAKNGC
jgi:pimeloyl-ACP methyl ester carboxylesterase